MKKLNTSYLDLNNDFGDYDRNDAYRTLIIMVMTMMIKLAEYLRLKKLNTSYLNEEDLTIW